MCISTGHFDFIFFLGAMSLIELRNLPKMKHTPETVGQHNSTETAQQNCMKLCGYEGQCVDMQFYRKCWFDPFEEQFISPVLSDCPSLMLGIAIHCIQHSQAMLKRGVCELAHSFFHSSFGVFKHWCSLIAKRKKNHIGSLFTQQYYVCRLLFVLNMNLLQEILDIFHFSSNLFWCMFKSTYTRFIGSLDALWYMLLYNWSSMNIWCWYIVAKATTSGIQECLEAVEKHLKVLDPPEEMEKRSDPYV